MREGFHRNRTGVARKRQVTLKLNLFARYRALAEIGRRGTKGQGMESNLLSTASSGLKVFLPSLCGNFLVSLSLSRPLLNQQLTASKGSQIKIEGEGGNC
jgi:hypothetical protein